MLAVQEPPVKQEKPAANQALKQPLPRGRWRGLLRRTLRQLPVQDLADHRHAGRRRIPCGAVALSVIAGFWLKLGSIRAIEDRLTVSSSFRRLLDTVGWNRRISDDTFTLALNLVSLPDLRRLLHRQAKAELARWGAGRYKASSLAQKLAGVGASGLAGRAVIAVDGHELFTSEHRSCPDCRIRRVTKKRKGELVIVSEHYHSAVFAQQIGAHPALMLDMEPLAPTGNELPAAYRLLQRLATTYGHRIGIVVADAAYDGGPFRRHCQDAGWYRVVRCKKGQIDPAKTALAVLNRRDPDRLRPDQSYTAPDGTLYECWAYAHLGWRYVECRRTRTVAGRRQVEHGACETDLPTDQASPVAVAMLMEARWSIENTGFHELAGAWDLDRAFVHAGKANAAWAIVLLALLAYNAMQAYVYRELGIDPLHPDRSLTAIRRDLWEDLGTLMARGPPA